MTDDTKRRKPKPLEEHDPSGFGLKTKNYSVNLGEEMGRMSDEFERFEQLSKNPVLLAGLLMGVGLLVSLAGSWFAVRRSV